MPQPDMRLVQWIADRLRYRPLPALIGHLCTITNLQKPESEITDCLSDLLPNLGRLADPDLYWIKEVLSKHGVLDLTFEASGDWLEDYQSGIELLNALGFLMDAQEAEQFDYVASLVGDNFEDPTMLGELQADLEQERTVLRLLLRGNADDQQKFVVADAAITNAASVWLHKYPYY